MAASKLKCTVMAEKTLESCVTAGICHRKSLCFFYLGAACTALFGCRHVPLCFFTLFFLNQTKPNWIGLAQSLEGRPSPYPGDRGDRAVARFG
jgi:hypothetical protein